MNILLITTLYPNSAKQHVLDASRAVHYFVEKWINYGANVKVIRISPKYPIIFNLFEKGKKAYKYSQGETFHIGKVEIIRMCIRKYPKIDYLGKDKAAVSRDIIKYVGEKFKPDVIVCHMVNPSLEIASTLKNEFNAPLVTVLHNSDIISFQNNRTRLKLFSQFKMEIDRLGFRSNKIKRIYQNTFGESDHLLKRSFVIPSGIDESEIIGNDEVAAKSKKTIRNIMTASKMIPLKNIDVLIKAFSKISYEDKLNLLIIGDGPERASLERLARLSQRSKDIKLLGKLERNEVIENMEEADVFVMVSAPETFGLVYLEAMAKGCIVIGSKGEGIDGVIEHGVNGYLCEPGNVSDLVRVLSQVNRLSYDEKKGIIENAVLTAKKLTQENVSTDYLNILKETAL